ncbi:SirB1 family protein [Paeniroseomonas aquatica]|uniref:Tetratricopeptide repeat protein n=1 Tax=Paeniroseomonas aquatica TaxID=373043 RepID=A0ABT8ACR1_9PROT|nr:tetratricopeptide repeat protein [Paeniroseomonas aquatica]MDN3567483.1 tetratricopeptide repeat protein [Paeniroseomonas aquatica]
MASNPQDDARAALTAAGQLPDAEIDLAAVALQLARIDAPEADWRAASAALSELAQAMVAAAAADPEADAGDAERRRLVLAEVIHARFGYAGDTEDYENPDNANLIRVVERRRGLPVALGVIWLHAAEAAGWAAHGVDFPGHFLLAVEGGRGQALIDVFAGGTGLQAPDLRGLIKRIEGDKAELRPGLVRLMEKRAVLLRLQNNLKLRRLRAQDLPGALSCAEDMLRLAPGQAGLWREAGLMNQRLDRIGAALACLEKSLELDPAGPAANRARMVVEELRHRLN